ncbi:MAG TPA: hypothetical protein V6C65_18695, partial [Allocoleopsis sp.]
PNWQETILLTIELLPDPDPLLKQMQERIQALVQSESTLQVILQWVHNQAEAYPLPYKPAAIRAFYLALDLIQGLDLAIALDAQISFNLHPELALDRALIQLLHQGQQLIGAPSLDQCFALCFALDMHQQFPLSERLREQLDQLKNELIETTLSQEDLQQWCQTQGVIWLDHLHQTLIQSRNIAHNWQLESDQKEMLQSYYQSTLFLIECLQHTTRSSHELQQVLEEKLLLP